MLSDCTLLPLVYGPVHSNSCSTPWGAYSLIGNHFRCSPTHHADGHLCPTRYPSLLGEERLLCFLMCLTQGHCSVSLGNFPCCARRGLNPQPLAWQSRVLTTQPPRLLGCSSLVSLYGCHGSVCCWCQYCFNSVYPLDPSKFSRLTINISRKL